jgi:ABC-2 type transport system permease protein
MVDVFRDIYSVVWVDLRFLRRHWRRTLATSLVNPLLYLVAFGYGLGQGITVEGYGSYLAFVMPGIIALTAMSSSYGGAGQKLHVDRLFYKCFDEYLMSPISLFSLAVGKALVGVVRGLISSVAILAVAVAISEIVISPLFVLSLVLSCFVFSFLGVLVGLVAKSHQDMGTFNTLVILPMTFLSGTFFSLSQLPEVAKAVLYMLPLTHSSQTLRAAALGQPFPWVSFVVRLGFGLAFFAGCMWALKRASV